MSNTSKYAECEISPLRNLNYQDTFESWNVEILRLNTELRLVKKWKSWLAYEILYSLESDISLQNWMIYKFSSAD